MFEIGRGIAIAGIWLGTAIMSHEDPGAVIYIALVATIVVSL